MIFTERGFSQQLWLPAEHGSGPAAPPCPCLRDPSQEAGAGIGENPGLAPTWIHLPECHLTGSTPAPAGSAHPSPAVSSSTPTAQASPVPV